MGSQLDTLSSLGGSTSSAQPKESHVQPLNSASGEGENAKSGIESGPCPRPRNITPVVDIDPKAERGRKKPFSEAFPSSGSISSSSRSRYTQLWLHGMRWDFCFVANHKFPDDRRRVVKW